jgi:hypothetical protein
LPAASRGSARVAVLIDPDVWRQEVERLDARSGARIAAERERSQLEREGVSRALLQRCEEEGPDGTRLGGLVKAYVPLREGPPSQRPFGFVFRPGRGQGQLILGLVAFGERHPRTGTRSVYERAHKRLHGRYADQWVPRD